MAKRWRTKIAFTADPAARLVTFSKRRKSLFKKASEICRLCSARAAVVVFSPAGKPYSFSDPSADDIVSEYLRELRSRSSAVESNLARSDLKGCEANAAGGGSLGAATTPTSSDLEDWGIDPVGFLTLLADGDGFLNSPEESAVTNDFVDLEDLDAQL